MRTVCKFRVTGVEDTEHRIGVDRVYEDQHPEEFARLDTKDEGFEYPSGTSRLGGCRKYRYRWAGKRAQNVRLAAIYDTDKLEDKRFCESTPSGDMRIYVTNPEVVGNFKPGDEYYIHLTPAWN